MGLSSLGAGDLILGGLITFKICHKPSYESAVVTKTVHLKQFIKRRWSCSNYVTRT